MVICCEKYFCGITIFIFILIQVATALLVAGSAPTFWTPPFASTSSYSSVFQSARLADGSFQLTHMSRDIHAVQLIEPWRPKRRQNIITAHTTLPRGKFRHLNISARQQSLRYGHNLRRPFLRATLAMTVGSCARAMAATGRQKGS